MCILAINENRLYQCLYGEDNSGALHSRDLRWSPQVRRVKPKGKKKKEAIYHFQNGVDRISGDEDGQDGTLQ